MLKGVWIVENWRLLEKSKWYRQGFEFKTAIEECGFPQMVVAKFKRSIQDGLISDDRDPELMKL